MSYRTTNVFLSADGVSNTTLIDGLLGANTGTTYFVLNGIEHIVLTPSKFFDDPLIPLIHITRAADGEWTQVGNYPEQAMGVARDFEFIDDRTAVFVDHGFEYQDGRQWPFGHVWLARFSDDRIDWTQISEDRGFYHSVTTGDFSGDGLTDIAVQNFGVFGDWLCDIFYVWEQQPDGAFAPVTGCPFGNPVGKNYAYGSIGSEDTDGDGVEELFLPGHINPLIPEFDTESFVIYEKPNVEDPYEIVKVIPAQGSFASPNLGASGIQLADLNRDGIKDIVVATVLGGASGIEVWFGRGDFDFEPSGQLFDYGDGNAEFSLIDVDEDGDLDIAVHPGDLKAYDFDLSRDPPGISTLNLSRIVLLNEGGVFSRTALTRELEIPRFVRWLRSVATSTGFKMIGIIPSESVPDNASRGAVEILEIDWEVPFTAPNNTLINLILPAVLRSREDGAE